LKKYWEMLEERESFQGDAAVYVWAHWETCLKRKIPSAETESYAPMSAGFFENGMCAANVESIFILRVDIRQPWKKRRFEYKEVGWGLLSSPIPRKYLHSPLSNFRTDTNLLYRHPISKLFPYIRYSLLDMINVLPMIYLEPRCGPADLPHTSIYMRHNQTRQLRPVSCSDTWSIATTSHWFDVRPASFSAKSPTPSSSEFCGLEHGRDPLYGTPSDDSGDTLSE
jgi:hypothetical protein